MNVSRRSFMVGGLAAVAASGPLAKCAPWPEHPPFPSTPFTLGVASGSPTSNGTVLWTRLAPVPLTGGGMEPTPVAVTWEVATDDTFSEIVAQGESPALPDFAHSVHVAVTGLPAGSWFAYRFRVHDWTSPVGRTRTAPAPGSHPGTLRLGVATCQHWCRGYYNAHAHMALEDLDLVIFAGDYIYEANATGPRTHGTPTAQTLADYRNRYALYKSDPDLQAAHAAFPWLVSYDDHEVVNNYAGDADSTGTSTPAFLARKQAAYQAWWEHQPVLPFRETWPDRIDSQQLLVWGDLARLALLDTRQNRTPYRCGSSLGVLCAAMTTPDVTMLGAWQEQWLADQIAAEPATWHVFAQQTAFSPLFPLPIGATVNLDQWDGYPGARNRLLDLMESPDVTNPVVLSGDIHMALAADIHRDGDVSNPRIGTELMTTSISSTFTAVAPEIYEGIQLGFDAVHHANARERGYLVCDVSDSQWDAHFRVVSTALTPGSTLSTDRTFSIPAVV